MDDSVEEIQPNVWRVNVAGITRVIRFRSDSMSFAPWDVTDADGRQLWSASSLESAFRWIQARTGYPAEALFAQALLEHGARNSAAPTDVPDASTQISKNRLSTPR